MAYRSLPKKQYENLNKYKEDKQRVGNGEQGKAVKISNDNETLNKIRVTLKCFFFKFKLLG